MDNHVLALPGAAVFLGLVAIGALLDGRRWAPALELARQVLTGAALAMWCWPRFGPMAAAAMLVAAAGSAMWFRSVARPAGATAAAA
jgi:hypothetical protein